MDLEILEDRANTRNITENNPTVHRLSELMLTGSMDLNVEGAEATTPPNQGGSSSWCFLEFFLKYPV